jgi:Uma2 family endonuclease
MGQDRQTNGRRYTWADYQCWPDDRRWEIIGGEPFAMSPSPNTRHQHICGELFAALLQYFRGKRCRPFISPMDVKLSEADIVQPDILVVCNPQQIKPTHIEGAPSLVIEILSPSSLAHDRVRKINLYAHFGVKELWIVNPFPAVLELFVLDGTSYRRQAAYERDQTITSTVFPDLRVPLFTVFDFPLEPGEKPPTVREGPAHYRLASDPEP